MRRGVNPLALVVVVMAIFACQTLYFYPHLPALMATHFGPSGQPDGSMTRIAFVSSFGVFLFFLTFFTSGITVALIRNAPMETINLPNKEYWLAPGRRATTLAVLSSYMVSLSAATAALMICIAQQIFRANLTSDPQLGSGPWVLLGAYLVFMVLWTISLVRRFQKPDS